MGGDGGDDKDRIVRNHECDECHKMFASVHSLNNHKKVHAGKFLINYQPS